MLSIRNIFNYNDIGRLKVKGWIKIYHTNINKKKTEVAVLTSDTIDFGAKKISVTENNII